MSLMTNQRSNGSPSSWRHGAFSQDDTYEFQTIIDDVAYLLTPELLSKIGQLVVESGHAVARKKPGEPLRGRCDSFVVETDVHYPTDVNLLWVAMRCLLRELGRAARKQSPRRLATSGDISRKW